MSRIRIFIVPVALIGALTFVFVWRDLYAAAWSPRQVILITFDGLRADQLGAYGYAAHPSSPNIDALAEQAVLFEHAFAAAPSARAALAALHTGRAPDASGGADGDAWQPDVATLAELFHRHGSDTAAFAFPATAIGERSGLRRGFDAASPQGPEPPAGAAGRDAALLAWLQAHAGRPFFLWLHDVEPADAAAPSDPALAGWSSSESAVYRGDALVGSLMRQLAALRMGKDLLVILTSPGDMAARDGVRRVPLLFAGPVFTPAHVDTPVDLLDVFPTITALAGLPSPPGLGGHSLVPLLRGQ